MRRNIKGPINLSLAGICDQQEIYFVLKLQVFDRDGKKLGLGQ